MNLKDAIYRNIELMASMDSSLIAEEQRMMAHVYFSRRNDNPIVEKLTIENIPNLYPESLKDWCNRIEELKGKVRVDEV